MVVELLAFGIAIALLALTVFLLWGGGKSSPFVEYGTGGAWARCAGLVVCDRAATFVLGCVAALVVGASFGTGGLIFLLCLVGVKLVIWLGGFMILFERSFGQALAAGVLMIVISFGLYGALTSLLG